VARFMGATVELPVTLHAGRPESPGLDLNALPRRALPDGAADLFIRPADILPVPDATSPWRIVSRVSNGANLRLVLGRADGATAEADIPRRAVQADALVPGTQARLRVEAGTVFPARRDATPSPKPAESKSPKLESSR
jgi:sulfate transport system ATP-binding protein